MQHFQSFDVYRTVPYICNLRAPQGVLPKNEEAMTPMKLTTTIIFAALLTFGLMSYTNINTFSGGVKGDGDVTTQDRDVSDFHGVAVSDGLDLILSQGDATSLTVTTDQNLQKLIITEVKKGILHIYCDKNIEHEKHTKVYLTFTEMDEISSTGGSDVIGEGLLKFTSVEISSTGGSDVEIDLESTELSLAATGGADIDISGSASNCVASVTGGSDLRAKNLEVETCELSASGAADAHVNVSGSIAFSAAGASDVHLYGKAKISAQSVTGASDFTRH